jgi:hypothetical protein
VLGRPGGGLGVAVAVGSDRRTASQVCSAHGTAPSQPGRMSARHRPESVPRPPLVPHRSISGRGGDPRPGEGRATGPTRPPVARHGIGQSDAPGRRTGRGGVVAGQAGKTSLRLGAGSSGRRDRTKGAVTGRSWARVAGTPSWSNRCQPSGIRRRAVSCGTELCSGSEALSRLPLPAQDTNSSRSCCLQTSVPSPRFADKIAPRWRGSDQPSSSRRRASGARCGWRGR